MPAEIGPEFITQKDAIYKKSSVNPYTKILDFSLLFIADAPMKKFTPLRTFGDTQYKNIFFLLW